MAGLYIHIPFCKSRCIYCDFYSTIHTEHIDILIKAECTELHTRASTCNDTIETIYFGGGTPSLLHYKHLEKLFKTIYQNYSVTNNAEITIEVNPEDLNKEKISEYVKLGIKRISLGIQSFDDEILKFLGRRHHALKAEQAVFDTYNAGVENINIDLIYGIPQLSNESWQRSLKKAIHLPVKHISAYHLAIEEGTPLHHRFVSGKINTISDEESIQQYYLLINILAQHHFLHYEVSNFSLKGYESKHNSSYWNNINYIGIGPSAHSCFGKTRRWNISSLFDYINKINNHIIYHEEEQLTEINMFNEYLLTRLRTNKGAYFSDLLSIDKNIYEKWKSKYRSLLNKKLVTEGKDLFFIDEKNWLMLDYILRELFV